MPVSEFDLDGFIGDEVETIRAKHEKARTPYLVSHIARVSREQNARERIQRNIGPKLAIREAAKLWVPGG